MGSGEKHQTDLFEVDAGSELDPEGLHIVLVPGAEWESVKSENTLLKARVAELEVQVMAHRNNVWK